LKVATLIAVVVTLIATGTSPAVQTAIARRATRRRLSRRRPALSVLAVVVALPCAPVAQAAFPGRDGQLLLGGGQNVLSVVAVHGRPHRIVSLYFNGQGCEADVRSAAFSPDGKRVAYTGVWSYDSPAFCIGYKPSQLGTEIVTASANGSHRHVLVRLPTGSNGGGLVNANYGVSLALAFSPNGRQLAYASPITVDSAPAITIIDAKTGKRRRTIGLSFPSSGLAWGSSGEIAYTTQSSIDAMRADGSHRRQITNGGRGTDSGPNWSPDGKKLAFLRDVQTLECFASDRAAPIARPADSNCSQVDHTDVYVVAANGSHLRRLTYFGQATGPVWSPDGKQIAFYDNNGHIIAVPAGGGRAKTLVTGAMIPADWQALPKPH
jgi:Tol biopolymer transport system component